MVVFFFLGGGGGGGELVMGSGGGRGGLPSTILEGHNNHTCRYRVKLLRTFSIYRVQDVIRVKVHLCTCQFLSNLLGRYCMFRSVSKSIGRGCIKHNQHSTKWLVLILCVCVVCVCVCVVCV